MNFLIEELMILAVLVGGFFLIREILVWHWKIDKKISALDKNFEEQEKINKNLSRQSTVNEEILKQIIQINENRIFRSSQKSQLNNFSFEAVNTSNAILNRLDTSNSINVFDKVLKIYKKNPLLFKYKNMSEEVLLKELQRNPENDLLKRYFTLTCLSNNQIKSRIREQFIDLSDEIIEKKAIVKKDIYAHIELERRKNEEI